jgi:NAD(P)-dependent dehydrogenase (short-subunit alcohol dehydrogenase family)
MAATDVNQNFARSVVAEIIAKGGKAISWEMDVANLNDVEIVVERMALYYGHIDIWVNYAGVSAMNHFVELTEKEWDFNMEVNARRNIFLFTGDCSSNVKTTPRFFNWFTREDDQRSQYGLQARSGCLFGPLCCQ